MNRKVNRRMLIEGIAMVALSAVVGASVPAVAGTAAPRLLGQMRAKVGESPWWDASRHRLWWVDTQAPAVLWTDLASGETARFVTPELAGGIVGADDGSMLIAMETGIFRHVPGRDGSLERVSAPPDLPPTHRFNDLTVDPLGRLIAGTMRKSQLGPLEQTGTLYSFDGGTWRRLADDLFTINGLAFSPAGDVIYWSDSFSEVNRIWRTSYDAVSGRRGATELFVDMRLHRGRPDGAAMDAHGGYWIAAIGGACLHRFLPDGTLERTLEVPVDHPTKPAFVGAALNDLAITSLSVRPSPLHPDDAGALTVLSAPFRGHPVPLVSLNGRADVGRSRS